MIREEQCLRKVGIRPYLAFSKTADGFAASELELFRSARKDGYAVIREAIEEAINAEGFQLWRLGKTSEVRA